MKPYRRDLKQLARSLRENMTDAEQLLWQRLRREQLQGMRFYRQKPLLNFIVDFYCPKAKLVVELDGAQHFEASGANKDRLRDECLRSLGLQVIRFHNRQVLLETEAVLVVIEQVMAWSKR